MLHYRPGLNKAQPEPSAIGVLLVNLGTPAAPSKAELKPYLKQFLSDPRVVEAPRLLWWLVLNGIILRTRPARLVKAYRKIWGDDGSPLFTISGKLAKKLEEHLRTQLTTPVHVELAMRYGQPSIPQALSRLAESNARRIIVLPLYPQYSATTTATSFDAVFDEMKQWRFMPELAGINHYYDQPEYIDAIAKSIEDHWRVTSRPQKLLFSFHSIPKRYSDQGDPYWEQCQQTAALVAHKLGLARDQWLVCFQSRFGKEEWLRPYADETIADLARAGTKHLHVVCPGFAADCLETLEEIDVENRHQFLNNGGENYSYIPALNDTRAHVEVLSTLVLRRTRVWL